MNVVYYGRCFAAVVLMSKTVRFAFTFVGVAVFLVHGHIFPSISLGTVYTRVYALATTRGRPPLFVGVQKLYHQLHYYRTYLSEPAMRLVRAV